MNIKPVVATPPVTPKFDITLSDLTLDDVRKIKALLGKVGGRQLSSDIYGPWRALSDFIEDNGGGEDKYTLVEQYTTREIGTIVFSG